MKLVRPPLLVLPSSFPFPPRRYFIEWKWRKERERGREEALHVYLVQDHPFRHVAPVRGRVYVIGNLGSRVCVIDRRVSPAYLRRCCTVLRAQSRVASWRRKWLRHEKVSRIRGARRNTFPLKRKKKKKKYAQWGNWNAVALFRSTLKTFPRFFRCFKRFRLFFPPLTRLRSLVEIV